MRYRDCFRLTDAAEREYSMPLGGPLQMGKASEQRQAWGEGHDHVPILSRPTVGRGTSAGSQEALRAPSIRTKQRVESDTERPKQPFWAAQMYSPIVPFPTWRTESECNQDHPVCCRSATSARRLSRAVSGPDFCWPMLEGCTKRVRYGALALVL